MIKNFIALLLLISPVFLSAQKKDKNLEKLAKSITAEDMKKHLYIIAGKEMEGRDTPSPGLERAANYIETILNHWACFRGIKIAIANIIHCIVIRFYPPH